MEDIKNQEQKEERKAVISFTQFDMRNFSSQIRQDLLDGGYLFTSKYTKQDIRMWLENPANYEKELRDLSNILYEKSQHYKRLVQYFAKMPTFAWTLRADIPRDKTPSKTDVQKKFFDISERVKNMNLPHELQKVMVVAFREDVFFGYEREEKNSYYIQPFNGEYCKIKGINDGVFTFSFDLRYFLNTSEENLNNYPLEIRTAYLEYKQGKYREEKRWHDVNPNKSICIKINEDKPNVVIPPFAGIFDAVFDLQDFKDSRKINDKLGNYKFFIQKIPLRENSDTINDFAIDKNTAMQFHQQTDANLPDEFVLITSPMEIQSHEFKNTNDLDNVAKGERDFYGASGVSQFLFNSDKTTTVGLAQSIKTDEQIVFGVLRQIERWINRKIKNEFRYKNYFFVEMLPVTHFNRKEMYDMYLQGAQNGFPFKFEIGATLGKSPADVVNSAFLENEVFNLDEKLIPLSSSHTQSGQSQNDGGRPKKEDNQLSNEGVRARDQGKRGQGANDNNRGIN